MHRLPVVYSLNAQHTKLKKYQQFNYVMQGHVLILSNAIQELATF